jgi:L-alanine-DL-glutamate epimerase-like enolase superfamily enzyme
MATATPAGIDTAVEALDLSTYTVPMEERESDGTLAWDSVTVVLVEARADGEVGLGYTYGEDAVGRLIHSKLAEEVVGSDALSPQAAWASMQHALRNAGQPGVGAMAISAVDIALWDLKARLLGLCLADLLGRFHDEVPVYGSGGFTSYSEERLREELSAWRGLGRVKIKVGRHPERDPDRLRLAREVIGDDVELMVDANGAFAPKDALHQAEAYARYGVTYLEEPVSSEDREGLCLVRDRAPAGMAVAAGEYGWTLSELAETADCVDVLQADATRCGGITNMLRVDGICRARNMPFSAHCAPAVSAHVCAAMESVEHIEYFHDHVRAEELLFEGTLEPANGALRPDPSRPGLGIELRRPDALEYES